jgi:hypothetical protein
MRKTTLADARKLGLVPSVTTILKVLAKPGLETWKQEQAILAALTTPRNNGEELDAFINRVLNVECQQDQEAQRAAERGTEIHQAIGEWFMGNEPDPVMRLWVRPVFECVRSLGEFVSCEKSLASEGYAGTIDLIQSTDPHDFLITDFKTTKKLPDPTKPNWPEKRLQCAAYANLLKNVLDTGKNYTIRTQNVYISTVDLGKFCIIENPNWSNDYIFGFNPLLHHWQWSNNMMPWV